METTKLQPETDIADEPYKGPGAFITGAGEGAVAHYGLGLLGLIGGGIGGFLFHGKINQGMTAWKSAAQNWQKSSTFIVSTLGKVSSWLVGSPKGTITHAIDKLRQASHGIGAEEIRHIEEILVRKEGGFVHGVAEHILKVPGLRGWLNKNSAPRVEAIIAAGGLLGVAGFVLSPIYFMITGARHANHGRHQFERAKEEILNSRAETEALRDKYVATKLELDDLKTAAPGNNLRVARDNTPTMQHANAGEQPGVLKDSPTKITAPVIQAPVIGPAATTGRVLGDSPTKITAPVIQEPVIGPAATTGRVLGDSPTKITAPPIKEPILGPEYAAKIEREAAARQANLETIR